MAKFEVKTRSNTIPNGKPRLYFTCHKEDFDRYFEDICTDVLKSHDCAIYYTPDMTEELDETNISVDLAQINLILVPVSYKLLTEPCRTMSVVPSSSQVSDDGEQLFSSNPNESDYL